MIYIIYSTIKLYYCICCLWRNPSHQFACCILQEHHLKKLSWCDNRVTVELFLILFWMFFPARCALICHLSSWLQLWHANRATSIRGSKMQQLIWFLLKHKGHTSHQYSYSCTSFLWASAPESKLWHIQRYQPSHCNSNSYLNPPQIHLCESLLEHTLIMVCVRLDNISDSDVINKPQRCHLWCALAQFKPVLFSLFPHWDVFHL